MTIPEYQERLLVGTRSTWPGMMDESDFREIVGAYEVAYPDVDFDVDWSSTRLNFKAVWRQGRRTIRLFGGLARRYPVGHECVRLMIAHEVAHFYGDGSWNKQKNLLCEGSADYEGAGSIMRGMCGGSYPSVIEDAICQYAGFLRTGCNPASAHGRARCNHPTPACRIMTMRAAVVGDSILGCAL